MARVPMPYRFSFPIYQTKCVVKFSFSQLMFGLSIAFCVCYHFINSNLAKD